MLRKEEMETTRLSQLLKKCTVMLYKLPRRESMEGRSSTKTMASTRGKAMMVRKEEMETKSIWSKTKFWVTLKIMWFVKWVKVEADFGAVACARKVSPTRARLTATSKATIFKPIPTPASSVPINF